MDNPKQTIGNFALLSLLVAGILIYLLKASSSLSSPLISVLQNPPCKLSDSSKALEDGLESALAKASMRNKTVIITIINQAYAEQDIDGETTMLDLFLNSFWLGEGTRFLLDHLLVVAVDLTAYDRCRFLRLNCFRLEADGVDFTGEKMYMSEDFVKMMWARTFFLLQILKRGYSFVFTDTDVMWLRNPLARLSNDEAEDLQISTDKYLGNPWLETHAINTGFYFVRSNNKTISLFETWYGKKDNATGQKEQDVLFDLIRHGIIEHLSLRVRFLDTLYFSGFCQDSKNVRVVTTVHANCCRSIFAKMADLNAVLRDWKRFKKFASINSLEADLMANFRWTGHFGCLNSWKKN